MPSLPSSIPAGISASLETLCRDLSQCCADNLAAVVLYGGVARGRYKADRSDVNLMLLLRNASGEALASMAPLLADARREIGVEAMVVAVDELLVSAYEFPTKFLDIKAHHVVLWGTAALADIDVPQRQVRLRIGQSLRNMLMRLRARYLAVHDDVDAQRTALSGMARPLAIELAALLVDAGVALPQEDRTAAIYALAAERFSLDRDVLENLARLRDQASLSDADVAVTYAHVLSLLTGLTREVEQLSGATA